MKNTEDKKNTKEFLIELKNSFGVAVKDKKRWIICLIELAISIVLIAVDLITKEFVYGACKENGKISVIDDVFSFVAVENTGASFGIFAENTFALTVVSLICSIVLLVFIFYTYSRRNLWLRSSLILILAGAVGNIIDRIAFGYVRDFIYFELIDFAVFNFADSCLTVGTIVLVIYVIFFYSKEEKELQEKKAKQRATLAQSGIARQECIPAQNVADSAEKVDADENVYSDEIVVENETEKDKDEK